MFIGKTRNPDAQNVWNIYPPKETNSIFAPENEWLEDKRFLSFWVFFSLFLRVNSLLVSGSVSERPLIRKYQRLPGWEFLEGFFPRRNHPKISSTVCDPKTLWHATSLTIPLPQKNTTKAEFFGGPQRMYRRKISF